MRRCYVFFFLSLLFLSPTVPAQPTDTGNRYDSTRAIVEKTVREWQDSIEREKLLQQIQKNGKSLDEFLAEMKEKERKEERRKRIRIGAGAILLFMLFFSIARRYRQRNRT